MDPRDAAESTGHYSRGRSASARYRDARSAGKQRTSCSCKVCALCT